MNQLRYPVVLFDLDGTLIDTRQLILASFRYALGRVLNRDYPDEVLLAGQGRPLIVQMQELGGSRAEELAALYTDFNLRYHDQLVQEFPGMTDLVADLAAAGARLGVVTSKRREATYLGLKRFGLLPHMAAVVCVEDTQEHKPAPGPVREALRRLEASPEQAVMVGDSPFDMESARAAGVEAVGVAWGSHPVQRLWQAGARAVFFTVAELREWLWGQASARPPVAPAR